jgi:hypothetical protein
MLNFLKLNLCFVRKNKRNKLSNENIGMACVETKYNETEVEVKTQRRSEDIKERY